MKKRIKKNKNILLKCMILVLSILSISANIYFYFKITSYGIGFGDAWSRLNISRRITDSLTPGLAQIGGVWLPFPQVLTVPFTAIDFLYFHGIAGAFISSPAYVMGGYFLYRLLQMVTKNKLISVLGVVLYGANPNLLYLQTTAMSEPLFICAMLGCVYYFLKYLEQKDNKVQILVLSGFWAFVSSLTRYEGFMLVAFLLLFVFISSWIKTKKYKNAEGTVLVIAMISLLGIAMWCIYSWTIFGDPLNWAKIYTGKKAVVSSVVEVPSDFYGVAQNKGKLGPVFYNLSISMFQMSSFILIPPFAVSLIGFVFLLIKYRNKKILEIIFVSLLLSTPVLFIILSGFEGGSLITVPPTSFSSIMNPRYHTLDEYNVRYGILALPLIIILCAYVFSRKKLLMRIFIPTVFLCTVFGFTDLPVTNYNFPKHYAYVKENVWKTDFSSWFKKNYDGGLILVSVISHDQDVYNLKLPYRNYIYEGTGEYWKKSIEDPTEYAKWIIMKGGSKVDTISGSSDLVSYYLSGSSVISKNYNMVYSDKDFLVYRKKQ